MESRKLSANRSPTAEYGIRQKEPDFLKLTLTKFRTLHADDKIDQDTQKLRKIQRKKFRARAASVNR